MTNKEIRIALIESGVHSYELAFHLGIPESRMSALLRYELPDEKKQELLAAIEEIKEGKER